MRSVYYAGCFIFTVALAPFASATVACGTTPSDGRPPWIAGLAIDLRHKYDGISVGSSDCTENVFYNPWNDPRNPNRRIMATTIVPDEGRLVRASTKGAGLKYTCDHVLELQLVKEIMEKRDGACDKANLLYTTDPEGAVEKLKNIRFHTWQHSNLYMLERATEIAKGNLIDKGMKWYSKQNWFLINEIHGYVTDSPGGSIQQVAVNIDEEIIAQFGADTATGVANRWAAYRAGVETVWQAAEAAAKAQVCKLANKEREKQAKRAARDASGGGGGAAGGGGAPPIATRRRAPTLPARMIRRHRSALAEVSVAESGITSSLVLRAAKHKTPRSGPKSPAAPNCPCNNKKQKKVVPRSKVKRNPPPATKPRKPTQTPAKRTPSPNKRQVKRPANRARREPGKQATPKRITPKRQPKRVPKPTQRPKGKPRTRRGRK